MSPRGELELGVIEQRASGGPALRRELDVAVVWPARQDAEQGGEVVERVEAVEAARGDEGEDRGRCLRVDVAAVEEPVLSTDDDRAESALAAGVVEGEAPVAEDAAQLGLLIGCVAERAREQRAPGLVPAALGDPHEEVVDERADRLGAGVLPLNGRELRERLSRSIDLLNATEPLDGAGVLRDRRLEKVAPAVRPATDEREAVVGGLGRTALEDVVDGARVALQEPREAGEQLLDGIGRVARRLVVEDVVAVGDDREEVALLAGLLAPARRALLGLSRGARRVRREHVAVGARVLEHRGDDGRAERAAEVLHVTAHGAAVERLLLGLEVLLEAVERDAQRELFTASQANTDVWQSARGNSARGCSTRSADFSPCLSTSKRATRLTSTRKPPRTYRS
jgi:hypothetical protein